MFSIPVSPFTPHHSTSKKSIHPKPNIINHIKYKPDNVGVWVKIDRNNSNETVQPSINQVPKPDEFPDLNQSIRNPNIPTAARFNTSSNNIYQRFKSHENAKNLIKQYGSNSNQHSRDKPEPKNIISFLFFNFPDSWNSVKLWGLFKQFGDITEVYIPKKTLKNGKRFGFVRYRNIPEHLVDSMVRKLNMIVVDGMLLVVYKAHDRKLHNVSNTHPPVNKPCQNNHPPTNKFTDDRKFSEVTAPQAQNESNKSSGFEPKYLGGRDVMLIFDDKKLALDVLNTSKLNENRNPLGNWFDDIQPWDPDEYSYPGRLVWVEIKGVPFTCWFESTFNDIAKEWGEIIEQKNCSIDEKVHKIYLQERFSSLLDHLNPFTVVPLSITGLHLHMLLFLKSTNLRLSLTPWITNHQFGMMMYYLMIMLRTKNPSWMVTKYLKVMRHKNRQKTCSIPTALATTILAPKIYHLRMGRLCLTRRDLLPASFQKILMTLIRTLSLKIMVIMNMLFHQIMIMFRKRTQVMITYRPL
ncbi:uncharacterized protein [Rutidosis leptorrhynchoides]|uniref:uncharacterized protein n=1 Tax=Rutidosis leptorrhynchoides TaxID=125765 RepID=UPI003A990470